MTVDALPGMTIKELKNLVFRTTGVPISQLRSRFVHLSSLESTSPNPYCSPILSSRDLVYKNDNATLEAYEINKDTEVQIILAQVK